MFRSKQDVDKHVEGVFRKLKNDNERNTKCFTFAKQYFKVGDYDSTVKFINRYLSCVPTSSQAYRLLGEAYEKSNKKNKALNAYKSSLELDGKQLELVQKVCQLLCDPEVDHDPNVVAYWVDRAEALFPKSPLIFQLKERLLKANANGTPTDEKLEKLYLSAMTAYPADVKPRVRLIEFYIKTGKSDTAYKRAVDFNCLGIFYNSLFWYDCLHQVVEAYEKNYTSLNMEFFIWKICWLERRANLSMEEFHCDTKKSITDCCTSLFQLDQALSSVSKRPELLRNQNEFYVELFNHMRCQLSFHIATLLLKRAKKEHGTWSKALKAASPLLLQATKITMDIDGSWYLVTPEMWKKSNDLKYWRKDAAFRVSQAGHVLLALAQDKGNFLEKVSQFCGGKWRERIYQDVFYNKEHLQAINTSYFITDNKYTEVPFRLPSLAQLQVYDKLSQSLYPGSLHYLAWLGLVKYLSDEHKLYEFRCHIVDDLQFSVDNLNSTGPETLNKLDVDGFLYATVLCAASASRNYVSSEKPSVLLASISEELCTSNQASWWSAVYKMYTNQVSGNISDLRFKLRKGIETVRATGQHGMNVKLLVKLAQIFQQRTEKQFTSDTKSALESRTSMYWSAAIPLLEKLEKNLIIHDVPNKLFDYRGKELSTNEVKNYLEDGKLYLGCQLMNQGRNEEAIQAFIPLKSPYATFHQAMIYKKLASEELNRKPELITSENRSQHIILLTRARDCLFLTLDRLRSPSVDANHPLNEELHVQLEEIETQLCRIDPDSNFNRHEEVASDESDVHGGPLSPVGVGPSFHSYANNVHSTPRVLRTSAINGTPRPHNFSFNSRTEARPSPERLDAQLRHLMQSYNTNIHTLVEQNQAIIHELKDVKNAVTDVKDSLNSLHQLQDINSHLGDIRATLQDILPEFKKLSRATGADGAAKVEDLKEDDLYGLPDDEDYEDLSPFQQFNQFQGYPNYNNYPQAGSSLLFGQPAPPAAPILPTPFHPASPRIDPMLLYQSLNYYQQNLAYNEAQGLPDFKGTGPQKGAPFAKSIQPAVAAEPPPIKPQPPNVVITSSDTLPVYTTSAAPIMSVTIPPKHLKGLSSQIKPSVTQPHAFQIAMPPQAHLVHQLPMPSTPVTLPIATSALLGSTPSPVYSAVKTPSTQWNSSFQSDKSGNRSSHSITEEEHDPCPDFQPIVPLPDEVEAISGEEEENKLFESRAKLYRFVDKEWKERGVGHIKILHNANTNKCRVLMRREQIFKICANHSITSDMELTRMSNNDKAFIWIAQDFAEEQVQVEKFCVRFKTIDEAKDFEYAFNTAKEITSAGDSPPEKMGKSNNRRSSPILEIKSKETAKPSPVKAVYWECKTCYIKNLGSRNKCEACESPRSETTPKVVPVSTADGKSNVGGFSFLEPPKFQPLSNDKVEPKSEEKKELSETKSIFSGWSFPATTTAPTLTFGLSTPTVLSSDKKEIPFSGGFNSTISSFGDFSQLATAGKSPEAFKKSDSFKGFEGAGAPVFSSLKLTPTGSEEKTKQRKNSEKSEDGQGDGTEFVPNVEFAPAVPLPDLIEIKTGEEDETVKFEERCKLLRYDAATKEWKERGIGKMKILVDNQTGRVRLLMRREQIFKICCNHHLTKELEFKPMTTSDKALLWIASDFAEGEYKTETFALKFGKTELMKLFKQTVEEIQSQLVDDRLPVADSTTHKTDAWQCGACKTSNEPSLTKCGVCQLVREQKQTKPQQKSLSEMFKPKPGTWECEVCLIRNEESANTCISCISPRPGLTPKPQQKSLSEMFKPKAGTWECEACLVRNEDSANTCISCTSPKTGSAPSKPEPKGIFLDPKLASQFSFGIPQGSQPAVASSTGVTSLTSPVTTGFTFGIPKTDTTVATSQPFKFTSPAPVKPELASNTDNKGEGFKFGSSGKFNFTFSGVKTPTKSPKSPAGPANTSGDESEGEVEEDEGEHIFFQPVVPLPDKVVVVTGEENEEILYCHRAKLFRFVGSDWKERGIGDLKILQHKTTKKTRFLMRRDQVFKICLNHYIDDEFEIIQKDDKTWLWCAADFSEGEVEHGRFAVRFKTSDIAQEFKTKLDDILKTIPKSLEKVSDDGGTPKSIDTKSVSRKLFSDDDIQVVYEAEVSQQLKEKALQMKLPPNFYNYLNKPECPGCIGCESEEENTSQKPNTTAPQSGFVFDANKFAAADKSIFGNSATKNLFGATPSNEGKPFFTSSKQETDPKSIFGGQPFTQASVFGGNSSTETKSIFEGQPSSGTGLFSFQPSVETNTQSGNIFGGSNIFGSKSSIFFEPPAAETAPAGNKTEFLFGSNLAAKVESKSPTTDTPPTVVFGSNVTVKEPNQTENKIASFDTETTFSNLSKSAAVFKTDPTKSFTWGGQVQPVFGSKETQEEDGDEGETDTSAHDPQFAPIVPLPDAVVVRSGEEDEDKLFGERAKLYRYEANTKEWKERGVGELKVLYHPINHTYRFLLRREQVFKVVLNQMISEDLQLQSLNSSDKAYCWFGLNYVEDEPSSEKLAVRFKNCEQAQQFYKVVEDCQNDLRKLAKEKPLLPLSLTNPSEAQEETGYDQDNEDYEYDDDDEEDDGNGVDEDDDDDDETEESDDDQNVRLLCDLYNFILYIYNEETEKFEIKGNNPYIQVIQTRDDTFKILIEETETGELISKTRICTLKDSIFKISSVDALWVTEDDASDKDCRQIFVRFGSEDDLNEFLKYFGAMEPPTEIVDFVKGAKELWTE